MTGLFPFHYPQTSNMLESNGEAMNRVVVIALIIMSIMLLAACPPVSMVIWILIALNGRASRAGNRRSRAAAQARAEIQRDRELMLALASLPC